MCRPTCRSSVYAANYGYYEDPDEVDLYEKMLRETDFAKQRALMREFEKYVIETEAHEIWVVWWYRIIPHRSYVKGWKISPSHYLNQDLATVWLDNDELERNAMIPGVPSTQAEDIGYGAQAPGCRDLGTRMTSATALCERRSLRSSARAVRAPAAADEEAPKRGGTLTYVIPADAPPSFDAPPRDHLCDDAFGGAVLQRADPHQSGQPGLDDRFRLRSVHGDAATDR